MVLELDLEGAVLLKLGRARAIDLVHLVAARSGEAGLVGAIVDVEAGLHGAERDLPPSVGSDDQGGGAAEVKMVAVHRSASMMRHRPTMGRLGVVTQTHQILGGGREREGGIDPLGPPEPGLA